MAKYTGRPRGGMRTRYWAAKREHRDWPRVIAEGDSWFDYPMNDDVIDHLLDKNQCAVYALSHHGDEVEDMIAKAEWLPHLHKEQPRCMLLSGGGNDLLGEPMARMLRDRKEVSDKTELVIESALKRQIAKLRGIYQRAIAATNAISPGLPIIGHGYDYALPTGRKTKFLWCGVAGHWIKRQTDEKGIKKFDEAAYVVTVLIDAFYDMLSDLAQKNPTFHLVDCRGLVAEDEWRDEIHPNKKGFAKVAKKFKEVIDGLP